MRNFVIINGVNSNTINGLGINELPPITKPEMRNIREEIDGRDGDITTNLGYSAYDKTITIGLFGTGYDINDIVAFFNGEGTIVFSNEQDKYYNFKILNQIDYESLQKFRTASITFHCQPFKYPLSETPLEIEYDYIEDEGGTLTLNNTGNATMKLDLKGNTSQYTTTGKNLLNNPITSQIVSGLTITRKEDGSLVLNGTTTQAVSLFTPIVEKLSLEAGTYIHSVKNMQSGLYVSLDNIGDTMCSPNQSASRTFTLSEAKQYTNYVLYIDSNKTFNNFVIEPMIRLASITDDTYEPYTNGASPNPNYPQAVSVVSGDNDVVVANANKLPYYQASTYSNNGIDYTSLGDGTYKLNNTATNTSYWEMALDEAYTIQAGDYIQLNNDIAISNVQFVLRDTTNTQIGAFGCTSVNKIYSLSSYAGRTIGRIRCYVVNGTAINNLTLRPMICNSSTQIDFVIHQSQTYEVDLPVENINFTPYKDGTSKTTNGITFSVNDKGEVIANGTASANAYFYFHTQDTSPYLNIPKGTYYLSGGINANSKIILRLYQDTTYVASFTDSGSGVSIDTSSYTYNRILLFIEVSNGTTLNNATFKPQLEKGSKQNSFAPYGKQIELCKIGTYQDYFTKNSGKNLFDKDTPSTIATTATWTPTTTGGKFTNTGTWGTGVRWRFVLDTTKQYTLKLNNSNNNINTYIRSYTDNTYSTEKTRILQDGAGNINKTFTPDSAYVEIYFLNSSAVSDIEISYIQLELGSATPYEPYGTGQWCKYNAIGKALMVGTEPGWATNQSTDDKIRFSCPEITQGAGVNNTGYSNYFLVRTENAKDGISVYDTSSIYVWIAKSVASDVASFKTWLTTHNTEIYYILKTPYLSLIEDNNLIEQLNELQNAMSYEGTTNISQVNNDKAFIISAKALEDGTNEVVVNNIGNVYSKPLLALEGSGNVDIYLDNTQILKANVEDKMNIDIAQLEAYNPDTMTLLNRQVIGNYNSMTLQPGNNTIRIDGALDKATITNYTRWL